MINEEISREREIEDKALEYQRSFSYENFRVIRKELFAHLHDPALTIRPESISFNTACINKLEDVTHIKVYIDSNAKQLAIKECNPDDKNAIRWCTVKKDGTRRSRKVTGREFSKMIYDLMGWDKTKRYKIIGFLIEVDGEKAFLFDMTMTENFDAVSKKKKKTIEEATQNGDVKQEVAQDSALESKTPSLSSFSEKIATTFGDTVEEDQARRSQDLSGFFEVQPSSMAGRGMNDGSF